jgi:hypothetical protein
MKGNPSGGWQSSEVMPDNLSIVPGQLKKSGAVFPVKRVIKIW